MIPFGPRFFFILCETTPEILGPWEKLEFPAMGTILLIVFKFSISSTTNHFYVFSRTQGQVPRHLACASIQIEW